MQKQSFLPLKVGKQVEISQGDRGNEAKRKRKHHFKSTNPWPLFQFKIGQFSAIADKFQNKKDILCFRLINVMKLISR